MLSRTILCIDGFDPVFLGSLDVNTSKELASVLEPLGVEILTDNEYLQDSYRKKLVANPAPKKQDVEIKEVDIENALNGPFTAFDNAPLATNCIVGRKEMLEVPVAYGISYKDVEDIPLEEAVMNLAAFIPYTRKNMTLKQIQTLSKKRFLSKSDYTKKEVVGFTSYIIENLLRENSKLGKSKIPKSVGFGKPVPGYDNLVEAPTFGSVGIPFLPNFTLVGDSKLTGERSLLTIIKETLSDLEDGSYYTKYINSRNKKTKDKQGKLKIKLTQKEIDVQILSLQLCLEALEQESVKSGTACAFASAGCMKACLVNSGMRYTGLKDILGYPIGYEDTDAEYKRLNLGFWQIAFIANPYYFLRLLIEAIYNHGMKHELELATYNVKQRYLGTKKDLINVSKYEKVIPASVRLNIFTDYPWELIYPDLFSLFDLKKPKGFADYQPMRIQFYDYTKVPGRWESSFRKSIYEEAGVKKKNLLFKDRRYTLPRNYHLTFSFNGTTRSFKHSLLSNLAGQNSTFVFKTNQLLNDSLTKIIQAANTEIGGFAGQGLVTQIKKVITEIRKKLNIEGKKIGYRAGSYSLESDYLPEVFTFRNRTYEVISGDDYDIRFLDRYQQKIDPKTGKLEPVIIGLNWKTPDNLKLEIGNENFAITPITAALVSDDIENRQIGLGFSFSRLGLNTQITPKEGSPFRLYFITEEPTESNLKEIIKNFVNVDTATFATETSRFINEGCSPVEISERLNSLLSEISAKD